MQTLAIKPADACTWDFLSLGEVMLRFDPGEDRISTARSFRVWEGGGEYNAARALRRCFGQRTSIVTALVDNPVGRLVEDLMLQGGVDQSHVLWRPYDGIGTESRNGIYFLERGFGVRGALGSMDRGHTAVSQLKPGDIDWERIFGVQGVRWFHTGGIFTALSDTTMQVAQEAMAAAKRHGTVVSYDANYRPSLWKMRGGRLAASKANASLTEAIDVLFGHEGDLSVEVIDASSGPPAHTAESYAAMAARVQSMHPGLKILATTTRTPHTANRNDWGAFAFDDAGIHLADGMPNLEVFDRVGGGDGFVAGFVFGLLQQWSTAKALQCGVASGALAMTTPGDSNFATMQEVSRLMAGGHAGVQR